MIHRNQLFIIPPDAWSSLDVDEVDATVAAMKEFGIYRLPYPVIDVWLPANSTFGWNLDHLLNEAHWDRNDLMRDIAHGLYEIRGNQYAPVKNSGMVFEFRNISLEHTNYSISMHIEPNSPAAKYYRTNEPTPPVPNTPAIAEHCRDQICNALIVLLATRNVVKTTERHKCARLGIGKRHRHEYVTTISLPREIDQDETNPNNSPGEPRCPHLRRGHVRRQHHGPHNSLVKQIWIEPVFVNADPNFVNSRKQYNVSL